MKEEINETHPKDSLISNSSLSTEKPVGYSAKEKLELMENQKNQDFFDVYDLVGSFKYKEVNRN